MTGPGRGEHAVGAGGLDAEEAHPAGGRVVAVAGHRGGGQGAHADLDDDHVGGALAGGEPGPRRSRRTRWCSPRSPSGARAGSPPTRCRTRRAFGRRGRGATRPSGRRRRRRCRRPRATVAPSPSMAVMRASAVPAGTKMRAAKPSSCRGAGHGAPVVAVGGRAEGERAQRVEGGGQLVDGRPTPARTRVARSSERWVAHDAPSILKAGRRRRLDSSFTQTWPRPSSPASVVEAVQRGGLVAGEAVEVDGRDVIPPDGAGQPSPERPSLTKKRVRCGIGVPSGGGGSRAGGACGRAARPRCATAGPSTVC